MENSKPRVIFTPEAFAKMVLLIMSSAGEIGWHGVVEEEAENVWKITDVLVYPQTVSPATVDTDPQEYAEWLYGLPDEQFTGLKAHFHSHVNMPVYPSGTDNRDKEKIIEQFKEDVDQFYIFMIWNKRLEFSADIFVTKTMTRYGAKDISLEIDGLGEVNDWIAKATENVKERKEVVTRTWTCQRVKQYLNLMN